MRKGRWIGPSRLQVWIGERSGLTRASEEVDSRPKCDGLLPPAA